MCVIIQEQHFHSYLSCQRSGSIVPGECMHVCIHSSMVLVWFTRGLEECNISWLKLIVEQRLDHMEVAK